MSNTRTNHVLNNLNIIWTIASKDIVDALRNKTVVTMIIMVSIMLLMPYMLPIIFEQPQTVLPVYDMGSSHLVTELGKTPDITVQELESHQALAKVLCSTTYPQIGLLLPLEMDEMVDAGGQVKLQGYVCWGKRRQVRELNGKLEEMLSQSLKQVVTIQVDGNYVYPPDKGGLWLSLASLNALNVVLMILLMGIFLVPSLLIEEKETQTMQPLLVSPASVGQVVIGKALAGFFYILVTALIIFVVMWAGVTHWEFVILLVTGGSLFSVAVGLVLGSFFDKQQDMMGWMSAIQVLLVGAIFVEMFGIKVPQVVGNIIPWIPSVALAYICQAAFSETVSTTQMLGKLGIIVAVSLPLYAVVVWKVRRSDR